MTQKTWYTALTGLLFLLLAIVSIATGVGDVDATKDPVSEIVDSVDDQTKIVVSLVAQALGAVALVWYAAHLRNAMRESSVAPVILVGAAIVAIGLAIDAALVFALLSATDDPDVPIAPETIQTVQLLYNNDFLPFIVGGSLLALSAGIATLQTGVFPKWLGWVAVVLGVATFFGPPGFIALLLFIVWMAVTSVMLALKTKNEGSRAPGSRGVADAATYTGAHEG